MKSVRFAYHAPAALDTALDLLSGEGARPLAGGQSLVPLMHARTVRPRALVDLNGVAGLDLVAVRDGTLVLGAMVRQRTLERDDTIGTHAPLLPQAVCWVASAPGRNRGALGGVENRPRRLPGAEALLTGEAPSTEAIKAAAEAATAAVEPRADVHASAAYRRHALGVLVRRGVEAAFSGGNER